VVFACSAVAVLGAAFFVNKNSKIKLMNNIKFTYYEPKRPLNRCEITLSNQVLENTKFFQNLQVFFEMELMQGQQQKMEGGLKITFEASEEKLRILQQVICEVVFFENHQN
jgi:hypothetical protein